jgi:glycosyltransferase involved in cell wall biosynthesis
VTVSIASRRPRGSVVVSSFNYARYLPEAIESALAQTAPGTEVVVVDDGSTDESREVIERYRGRVRAVLKENGGQASAFNAGFAASRGDAVLFLDSDDVLLPEAMESALEALRPAGVVKAQWPLVEIDAEGRRTGRFVPPEGLRGGSLRAELIETGLAEYDWPPTSGNAWSRRLLDELLPMPEAPYRTCPDIYLGALARLYGRIEVVDEPQSLYRLHGRNNVDRITYDEERERLDHVYAALHERLHAQGVEVDVERWKAQSWVHRLPRLREDLRGLLPTGAPIAVLDEDTLRSELQDWTTVSFSARDGEYWGPPADDEHAIAEVERLRSTGVDYLVVAWPAFWWLEFYARFGERLRRSFPCLLENERVVVFDLRPGRNGVPALPGAATDKRVSSTFGFAADVESAVTEAECCRLASLATGKVVLELGSWLGRSTIALASTADIVHAVDWHRGDEHAGHHDTLQEFLLNLARHGVRDKVIVHLGRFEDVARILKPKGFDVIFIDGLHTRAAVDADISSFLSALRNGGSLAFHDYGRFEVKEAVDAFARGLGVDVEVTETLAVVAQATGEEG